MAGQKSVSGKRQRSLNNLSSNSKPVAKRRRTMKTETKITDVNNDCLVRVFEYLSFDDLLSIAEANKRLRQAAGFVFARAFGTRAIYLNVTLSYREGTVEVNDERISINDLKTSLQILRNFGPWIKKLELAYAPFTFPQRREEVDRYIMKYCAASLTDLELNALAENSFKDLRKPFSNVEKVRFNFGTLGKKLTQFNRWFPKMRCLELMSNQFADSKCIETSFPSLTELMVGASTESNGLKHENIVRSLSLNRQLTNLSLRSVSDPTLFQSANEYLPNLESLDITWDLKYSFKFNGKKIHFKNVKKVNMCVFTKDNRIPLKIPFSFNQLEEFRLQTGSQLNKELTDFITKHPAVSKLSIVPRYQFEYQDISEQLLVKITEALPALKEINFAEHKLSANQAITFIRRTHSLEHIHFKISKRSEFKLFEQINEKWHSDMNNEFYVELQKNKMN